MTDSVLNDTIVESAQERHNSKEKRVILLNRPYPFYELPQIESLRDMIRQQVEENPNRIAFRFRQGREIVQKTILQFSEDIDAVGTWLFHEGIQNSHIALIAPNSYLWLVVYFAVISSGNVIVPIDKDLTIAELEKLLLHSESTCVFAADKIAGQLEKSRRVLPFKDLDAIIEQGRSLVASGDTSFTGYNQDVHQLSTIVYTSGTTGDSKGVMLTQANLLADINTGCRLFKPGDRSLSVLPFHHMFGLAVALLMLVNWRSTVFINSGLRYLMQDFQEARPLTTMLVPLHLQTFHKMIVERAKKEGKYKKLRAGMKLSLFLYSLGIDVLKKLMQEVRKPFGGDLEYIIVGGAALDPFYEREYRAWGIDLIPAYGATECSPGIACGRNHYHREGSVGKPIDCLELRIADDGEVMIRGENVMKGYWHDEQATAQALKDGWYMSGDIGHLDKDGFLFLTGRKKNLIILSDGENVSPEKLESQIGLIEGVSEVLVYQEDDAIVAEIYPDDAYAGRQEWFDEQIKKYNNSLPPAQRIRNVKLRTEPFPKNTSRKILRHQTGKEKKDV